MQLRALSSLKRNNGAVKLFALLFCALALCLCGGGAVATTVIDYTVTAISSADIGRLPPEHWAHYKSICSSTSPTQSWNSISVLSHVFPAISLSKTRTPFYAYDRTPWYVTHAGFLSPTSYGMCDGFCTRDFFATLQGNYGFSDNTSIFYDGGGDWPMISLYSALLDNRGDAARPLVVTQEFFERADGRVSRKKHERDSGSASPHTLVEYCDVPLKGSPSSATGLTAQVAVYANGTIVMRYKQLPDPLPDDVRSTGLIYSKTLRKVVPTPTADNGIVAYRFDPVYDVCDGATTASACAGMRRTAGDAGVDCVWCPSTSACASRAFVSEVCPRGQWAMRADEDGAAAQKFYTVSVDFNGDFDVRPDPMSSTTYLGDYAYFSLLPYVYTILFSRDFDNFSCGPGFFCSGGIPGEECNPVGNTCPNGNFTRSILALQSALRWSADAYVTFRYLGSRRMGSELCRESLCDVGTLFLLNGSVPISSSTSDSVFTVQLYFDRGGVVDIVIKNTMVEDGAPMLTFPSMFVGLVRYGVDDPASVLVPQGLLRSGVHARFVPLTSCPDCGLHGTCDEDTGKCGCMPGYYGASCRACPVCEDGSRCDDGVAGSGGCVCVGGACGATYGVRCGEGGCEGCSALGGRCECGTCVCVDGWTGANCDVAPVDGCRAYSFDGCAVCGSHADCEFCFDSTCFNTSLVGTASGYTCSYSTPAVDARACRTYASVFGALYRVSDSADAVVVVLCMMLAVMIVFAGVVWACEVRTRRVVDLTTAYAVGGTTVPAAPHREREVIQVSFVRRNIHKKPLTAIPLKQVSLARLFKRRKEALEEQ
ncbi:hypothetical protein ABB37_09142 [Leptomonas pyrrhocoris]|uniref:EGF-like domain-containing protein n=1 Tax=Leptomonas pyrrhocoris TaxID=157538 RepID=A0A0N0DRC8_LEPPY|nr:hypothetical protein ABB37_09142 [Leptomonas pyrrhocoris]KPA74462.1 hypothetical protein ABB37_09142 [Leptomonas pyrrhocoris]|eukprot:XP_015652901.1 hypothetical protein ABB37_09142 [Leptomonas pyrrhocoris]